MPCGKCIPCRKRHASNWSIRLSKEAERASSAFFLTLTYDNDHIPISDRGYMTLDYGHLTAFFKKLRKKNKTGIKYYAVGEYGGRSERPHFHIVIFNMRLATFVNETTAYLHLNGNVPMDGTYECMSTIWDKGHVTIGQVNEASIGYCVMYIHKGSDIPLHDKDDRLPEQARMSKGIGAHYVDQMYDWHINEEILERMYTPLPGGKKAAMPRYYRDRIYTVDELEAIKETMNIRQLEANAKLSFGEFTNNRNTRDVIRDKVERNKKSKL